MKFAPAFWMLAFVLLATGGCKDGWFNEAHATPSTPETPVTSHASDLTIIATAKAKPGKEAELEQALREVAGPTRKQPGSVHFTLLRVKDSPATVVAIERWASEKDHDQHLKGAHVQKLMGKMANILAEPPSIVAYEILDD